MWKLIDEESWLLKKVTTLRLLISPSSDRCCSVWTCDQTCHVCLMARGTAYICEAWCHQCHCFAQSTSQISLLDVMDTALHMELKETDWNWKKLNFSLNKQSKKFYSKVSAAINPTLPDLVKHSWCSLCRYLCHWLSGNEGCWQNKMDHWDSLSWPGTMNQRKTWSYLIHLLPSSGTSTKYIGSTPKEHKIHLMDK